MIKLYKTQHYIPKYTKFMAYDEDNNKRSMCRPDIRLAVLCGIRTESREVQNIVQENNLALIGEFENIQELIETFPEEFI